MTRKTVLAWSAAMSLAAMAFAQQNAAVTLRSGERLSAQLMDLGGVGYTVRVDGQERQIPASEVAAIDFTGGSISTTDWDKLSSGGQVLILKSGETITGQLVDIGGSAPLRITFRTPSGERDFSSSDIARIVMSRPDNTNAATATAGSSGSSGAQGVTVASQQQWTPTGITVRRGDSVTFNASGEVRIGSEGNPAIGPAGLSGVLAPGAPIANAPSGALIGRVGNSAAFLIGNQSRVQMPASGQLFLGVNDGNLPDNSGSFQVQVAPESSATRRR
jgi:PA-IL-like protein